MIVKYWREFHPHVGTESYVADVGYIRSTDCLVLVELGPFLPCTGASCFRWATDTQLLQKGPLEFRLRTAEEGLPHETLRELVDVSWLHNWRSGYHPYSEMLKRILASDPAANRSVMSMLLSGASSVVSSIIARLTRGRGATAAASNEQLLFVYGTLKRGFHWNSKFLAERSTFVGEAQTVKPWPLVVGRCGVPYILLKQAEPLGEHCVLGEVWRIDLEALAAMDEYEGITKGYYGRDDVECQMIVQAGSGDIDLPNTVRAQMYGVIDPNHFWSREELSGLESIPEYTLQIHKESYCAIEHISLKQQLYLAGSRRYDAQDEHTQPAQGKS
eukprot:TRINITY_DN53461_c0_g1_i3.p1 TRINITY_DN53461_c0_g1~~TRINITY_DN53461_c0_g1_i3.p1  ORF type:complete len:330 (+),score=10.56 TRINITY_DN53461_c0_g1_i3:173-1162(+)